MVLSFSDFINENSSDINSFVSKIVNDLLSIIKKSPKDKTDKYFKAKHLEYLKPLTFDLRLIIKRTSSPDFKSDQHFNSLPWEEINFKNHGFSIDANTYVDRDELMVPEIEIVLLMNPDSEPESYTELYYKLNDIVMHEVHHLTQVGWNRKPFRVRPSYHKHRNNAKHSYKYFLLPDEIEAMVKGMYRRAKLEKRNLDEVFDSYLRPYIEHKYITPKEYDIVLVKWIKYAVENYPGVKFSSKVKNIIDSI